MPTNKVCKVNQQLATAKHVIGIEKEFSLRKPNPISPLWIVLTFYAYFAMGNVFLYSVGLPIFSGTRFDQIGNATVVFVLFALACLGGWGFWSLVPHRNRPAGRSIHLLSATQVRFIFGYTLAAIFALNVLSALNLLSIGYWSTFSIKSGAKPPMMAMTIHYGYLALMQIFICLHVWICLIGYRRFSTFGLVNFAAFLSYCLITQERDFIFFAPTVYYYLIARGVRIRLHHSLAAGGACIAAAAALFFVRGSATGLNALGLNQFEVAIDLLFSQGSNLLVTTNIIAWTSAHDFLYGSTYIHAVASILPRFLWDSGAGVQTWFIEQFFPNSQSGYGFSIEGEAYLNFGYLGVATVGLGFGAILCAFWRGFRSLRPVSTFMFLYSIMFALYAIRGDAVMLLKGLIYALALCTFSILISKIFSSNARLVPRVRPISSRTQ